MKRLLAGAAICLTAGYGSAVEVGTGIWQQSLGGNIANNTLSMTDLGLEGSNDLYFYATIDMPLIIPNLKIRSQSLTASGSGTFTYAGAAEFSGVKLSDFSGANVTSAFDLSYLDVVAHYGLPIPVANVDFGLAFRLINGSFSIADDANTIPTQKGDFMLPIPMLHVAAGMPLPANLSVYGEYNLLPLADLSVSDLMVKVKYVLPVPTLVVDLGVEAGYHDFSIKVSNTTDMDTDINSKGFFVGVSAEF